MLNLNFPANILNSRICVFLPPEAVQFTKFHLEKNAGVFHQGCEHEYNTANDPGFHSSQSFCLKSRSPCM